MQRRMRYGIYVVSLAAICLVPALAWGQIQPSALWLDQAVHNWNDPRAGIPRAPSSFDDSNPLCDQQQRRAPSSSEERGVSSAGWKLNGPTETVGATVIISARVGLDGMCRPMGFQSFVFVNRQFAGTISPVPMDSRTDGSGGVVQFNTEFTMLAEFARYGPSDPLCCASRTSRVSFTIERRSGRPVLVPETIQTFRHR